MQKYDQALGCRQPATAVRRSSSVECNGVCYFPSSTRPIAWKCDPGKAMRLALHGEPAGSADAIDPPERVRGAPPSRRPRALTGSSPVGTCSVHLEAMPAATLRPVVPSMLTGCNAIELTGAANQHVGADPDADRRAASYHAGIGPRPGSLAPDWRSGRSRSKQSRRPAGTRCRPRICLSRRHNVAEAEPAQGTNVQLTARDEPKKQSEAAGYIAGQHPDPARP